jgi:hypothetical protein
MLRTDYPDDDPSEIFKDILDPVTSYWDDEEDEDSLDDWDWHEACDRDPFDDDYDYLYGYPGIQSHLTRWQDLCQNAVFFYVDFREQIRTIIYEIQFYLRHHAWPDSEFPF